MLPSLKAPAMGLGAVLGVAALGYLAYRYLKPAIEAGALDPTSANNLAYRGANSVFSAVTGNAVDSIGTAVYNSTRSLAEQMGLAPNEYLDEQGRIVTRPASIFSGPLFSGEQNIGALDFAERDALSGLRTAPPGYYWATTPSGAATLLAWST